MRVARFWPLTTAMILTGCETPSEVAPTPTVEIYARGERSPQLMYSDSDVSEPGERCGPNCAAFSNIVIVWPERREVGHVWRVNEITLLIRDITIENGEDVVVIRGTTDTVVFEYRVSNCEEPAEIVWLTGGTPVTQSAVIHDIFSDCDG